MANTEQKSPGSTLAPSSVSSPELIGGKTKTDRFQMGGVEVNGITHDHQSADPGKLSTAFALASSMIGVNRDLEEMRNTLGKVYFSPVLSDPILNPFFVDTNWGFDGFTIDVNELLYINKKPVIPAQATARVLTPAFQKPGRHFVYLVVTELTSGSITLSNEKGTILKEITIPGEYSLEIEVEQPSIALLDIVANNINTNESCRIACIFVHYVKTAFNRYMDYMASKMLSGGSGFASVAYVDTVGSNVLRQARDYTDVRLTSFGEDIEMHLRSKNNPHGVTYDQTGAAPLHHTHVASECGAADVNHTHTPEQAGAAPIVHTHTPSECGAAAVVHTHTPDQCGAAPVSHDHSINDLRDYNLIEAEFNRVYAAIAAGGSDTSAIQTALSSHTENRDNPHAVTKVQVGLGEVVNAPMATDQEAIDGVLTNRYMNPATTRVALASTLAQPNVSTAQFTPIKKAVLDFQGEMEVFNLLIEKDRVYWILIDCEESMSLKDLALTIDALGGTENIRNSFVVPTTITTPEGKVSVMAKKDVVANHFKLMHPDQGINGGGGHLVLDTRTMTLSGTIQGRVLDQITGAELNDSVGFPVNVSSGYKMNAVPQTVQSLIVHSWSGQPVFATVTVFEVVQTTQQPALVVDATPVGMLVFRMSSDPVHGWIYPDGSELLRESYPELFRYAQENNLLVTEQEWQQLVTDTGRTNKYSLGDGYTTFRVPKFTIPDMTAYIKARHVQVPDEGEILYRTIWEA